MSSTNSRNVQKIVVIGPESTGKSSLCEALAIHYKTIWCKEYAREFFNKNGIAYNYETLTTIARGQLAEEEAAIEMVLAQIKNNGSNKLIIDTEMYVMKVWSEYVFNNCDPLILEKINERSYDLYLLCDIDLPWTKDEMREYPNEAPRKELFMIYKDLLVNQNTPWAVVSGQGEDRIKNAINAIEAQLENK